MVTIGLAKIKITTKIIVASKAWYLIESSTLSLLLRDFITIIEPGNRQKPLCNTQYRIKQTSTSTDNSINSNRMFSSVGV
jgi:hypothetical protein